jgi:hypothetical protein
MGFLAFPFAVNRVGRLAQFKSAEDSILELFKIMDRTPQFGWSGSTVFGLRDSLEALQSKSDMRLSIIRQINATLQDLGIDWVRADDIQVEPGGLPHDRSYVLTLSYVGKGQVTHRLTS